MKVHLNYFFAGDVFRNLEMAFMGTVGARKGKWSFMLDTIYLDAKDSKNFTIPGAVYSTLMRKVWWN